MKTLNICISVLLFISMTACEKWFDVSPQSELKAEDLFKDERGFRDALIGVYGLMSGASGYGRELSFGYLDVLAQYYDNVESTANHPYAEAAKFNYNITTEEDRLSAIWKNQFKAIANTNALLAFIDQKKEVFTGNNYQLMKGEALALRAYLHFDVLRMFAPAPVTGIDQPAIPYVDQYTNIPFPQLTIKQILEKIVQDAAQAKDLLKKADPWGPSYADWNMDELPDMLENRNYRMNYYATTALLARVYLYAQEKGKAATEASEVINSGLFSLITAEDINKGDKLFKKEFIFALNLTEMQDLTDRYFGEEAVNSALTLNSENRKQIYQSAGTTDVDYRLNNWFKQSSDGSYKLAKYDKEVSLPLLKLSEMYLIAAEDTENTSLAITSYMNVFQKFRGLQEMPDNTGRPALLEEISKEYRKEFMGEGQLFYYFKRNQKNELPLIGTISSLQEIYNLPIPVTEKEFGNIK